ncbi:MAG TPA: TatD family hydrolase [Thermoanaerobaculia bacterium]|nr:TatD family hydrolase [Thermoanaerobaculia bacterium]
MNDLIFTDSHCHLAMVPPESLDATLDRARGEGVRGFLVPGTHMEDSPVAVGIAQRYDDVWSAVGFHPHEAKDCDAAALDRIDALASLPRVVAIGEIGLDYHYEHSPREIQKDVLLAQISLAIRHDLPVLIHNRESNEDLLSLLDSSEAKGVRGLIHSFTESREIAKRFLDLGFFISFSGIVTFKTAAVLRDAAASIPRDRALIETDSPFLAPVPHRGKQNEPAYVLRTAEALADAWGCGIDEVARATTANFESLFRVQVSR